MNTRSIRFRLTAWYAGLLVALGLVFGVYCYWRLDHFLSLYVTEAFAHRAERIGAALLGKADQNGEADVRTEIEARYAPEANERFMRVTSVDGGVVYVSGEPNDRSFEPQAVPLPAPTLSGASTRIEHVGSADLLIASVPFVTAHQKYVIEVGGSASPIKNVLYRFLVSLLIGLSTVVGAAI